MRHPSLLQALVAFSAFANAAPTKPAKTTVPSTTITQSYIATSTTSGYLQASGSSIVDHTGKPVVLHGVNLGGWLVLEDWMCGITDITDTDGRQARETLETRFGSSIASQLVDIWEQNFVSAQDFTNIKNLGFNLIRLPFSYQTLQYNNGTWREDAFTRLDWAVKQAKAHGIWIVLSFHVWDGQSVDYSTISENTPDGQTQRQKAQKVWQNVTEHYLNESTIAAFDVINEPTGSYANYLQRDLYSAVRSIDPDRLIVLESFSAKPSTYNFTQVIYSFHEYKLMGDDLVSNEQAWEADKALVQQFQSLPVPVYIGEFMAGSSSVEYLLQQMDSMSLARSSWTYKAVDEGGWAFYNYPSSTRVNINEDSYEHILSVWEGLSETSATANTQLMSLFTGS